MHSQPKDAYPNVRWFWPVAAGCAPHTRLFLLVLQAPWYNRRDDSVCKLYAHGNLIRNHLQ